MSNIKEAKSKPIKITLTDGVERTVRFTLNAMSELEDRYGSVDKAFEALDAGSIKALRFVLWAGLMHEDASLTEHMVGDLIDIQYMESLMTSLGEAFEQDMPKQIQETSSENTQGPNA